MIILENLQEIFTLYEKKHYIRILSIKCIFNNFLNNT